MHFVDTHAHLDFEYEANLDTKKIIDNANKAGVSKIITISSDLKSIDNASKISQDFENVFHSLGLHPHDAKDFNNEVANKIIALKNKKTVAIGETGLDYYYEHSPRDIQKKVFIEQIELSYELKLPLIIHVREADKDCYEILSSETKDNELKGVLHCYSGTKNELKKYLDLGFYVSFTGIITFPKAELVKESAQYAPKDRIMLETDSPFLAPIPYRGKKNYPEYIPIIAQKLSELRGESLETVANYTTKNAETLFGIWKPMTILQKNTWLKIKIIYKYFKNWS